MDKDALKSIIEDAHKLAKADIAPDLVKPAVETIADIIAEMRKDKRVDSNLMWDNSQVEEHDLHYADRIDAAYKRERGDCAKLREVVDAMMYEAFALCDSCVKPAAERGKLLAKWCNKLRAALAATPRNCDKVKTSWDVLKEWHEGLDTANDIVRLLDWLLAPATEKEGGDK